MRNEAEAVNLFDIHNLVPQITQMAVVSRTLTDRGRGTAEINIRHACFCKICESADTLLTLQQWPSRPSTLGAPILTGGLPLDKAIVKILEREIAGPFSLIVGTQL